MGTVSHHAIIVTGWKEAPIRLAHALATELMASQVTPILRAHVNGYFSFAVLPDGSKDGWTDSDHGDQQREKLKVLLRTPEYEDGSSSVEWVEVLYGHDVGDETAVTECSDYVLVDEDEPPPQGTGTEEGK